MTASCKGGPKGNVTTRKAPQDARESDNQNAGRNPNREKAQGGKATQTRAQATANPRSELR